MKQIIPTIDQFMTKVPHTINSHQTLSYAKKMMYEFQIRHLPVMDHKNVVGILSQHDLDYLLSFRGVDPNVETVEQAMSVDPYCVKTGTQIVDACLVMAENKYSCVLVKDENQLVGIFTWVDALRSMHQLLNSRA